MSKAQGPEEYVPYPLLRDLQKVSKILNTFFFLFSTEMLVIIAETHKMLVKVAHREAPDQTASSYAVRLGSAPYFFFFARQLVFEY